MRFVRSSADANGTKHVIVRRIWTGTKLSTALVAIWFLLPTNLGGHTRFVIVSGSSMEPTYHLKDMLIVRDTSSPKVGSPAVYRMKFGNDGKSVLIVHRIIGQDKQGQFIFKGDNRKTEDPSHISPKDVLGTPVADLGPLPTRILAAVPLYGSILISMSVVWLLWPRRPRSEVDADREAVDTGPPALDQPGETHLEEEPIGSLHALHSRAAPTPGQRRLRRMLEEAAS